jgi:chromosomal replication initiation ATPase DnaA
MLFLPQRQLTFANFQCRPGSVRARGACAGFVLGEGTAYREPVLILAGPPGSGKTHLLHAAANFSKTHQDEDSTSSTLTALRLAEEVHRALEFRDLPIWMNRFAAEDFLAIDDVDHLLHDSTASDFLLKVLQIRSSKRRKTLLTSGLSTIPSPACQLNSFLNHQTAVRLT